MTRRTIALCFGLLLICILPGSALAQEPEQPGTGQPQEQGAQPPQARSETVRAEVVEILEEGTTTVGPVTQPYQKLVVELTSGSERGKRIQIDVGLIELNRSIQGYEPGDDVYVMHVRATTPDEREYYIITDRVRTPPLLALAILFAVAIVLMGKWKGVRSLIGMVLTFAVIIWWLIPRILDGSDPIFTSISSAFVIFSVTLFLVHGVSRMTAAAITGTTIALAITGALAWIFVRAAHLTGLASEEAALVQVAAGGQLSAEGLLLGGIIIGALGVLDDITVSQSSTIFELRKANPLLSAQHLFSAGVRVGRDHIAATVNTLVLAYVGAALPLMILFSQADQPLAHILNRELVAEEIVRTLVGSLGLISAVPLTTGIASWLAVRTHPEAIDTHGHGHSHGHGHGHGQGHHH